MVSTSRARYSDIPSDAELASIVGGEINALFLEAMTVLEQRNNDQTSVERLSIKESALGSYGSPTPVLRKLITHLPKHNALSIITSHEAAIDSGLSEDELLTAAHIIVSQSLNNFWIELSVSGGLSPMPAAPSAEFKSIMSYAMNNIHDGHLIVSLYGERGIHTYQEILDFLPILKSSGVLAEGAI